MKFVAAGKMEFSPASHENPDNPGVFKKVLLGQTDFQDGTLKMLNWCRLPVGSAFQPHFHEDLQEVFVIARGTASMSVDGQTHLLEAGDCIVIDSREIHVMQNTCNEDVFYMVFGISRDEGGKTVVVSDLI